MSKLEDFQRNLLFIIVTILFFLFATGRAAPVPTPEAPIVIP